jgi:hypothetical protein
MKFDTCEMFVDTRLTSHVPQERYPEILRIDCYMYFKSKTYFREVPFLYNNFTGYVYMHMNQLCKSSNTK